VNVTNDLRGNVKLTAPVDAFDVTVRGDVETATPSRRVTVTVNVQDVQGSLKPLYKTPETVMSDAL